eukprot:3348566-Amphidinium_carterae.2
MQQKVYYGPVACAFVHFSISVAVHVITSLWKSVQIVHGASSNKISLKKASHKSKNVQPWTAPHKDA